MSSEKCYCHSGAPNDVDYERATEELSEQLVSLCSKVGVTPPDIVDIEVESPPKSGVSKEYVAEGYGQALLRLGEQDPKGCGSGW